jgi:hypothetical protein
MKNEQLHPIKPFAMEVPANKEPLVRLEKKPSKKLVIKANDRIPEPTSSGRQEKKLEHIADAESIVIKQEQIVVNRKE